MKKWLLAAALLCSAASADAQSFVAYESGDPSAWPQPQRGLDGYIAIDWEFDVFPFRGPRVQKLWAFGFVYTGQTALLETISAPIFTLEGNALGIQLLEGAARENSQLLQSWEVPFNSMMRTPNQSGVGVFDVRPSTETWLSTGETYWLSFTAAGEPNIRGQGYGVWGGFGSFLDTDLTAFSTDLGQTWTEQAGTQMVFRVTAVPEPNSVVLLVLGAGGLALLGRRRLAR